MANPKNKKRGTSGIRECKRCGELVIWAWTIPGYKLMPINRFPVDRDDPAGTIALETSPAGGKYCRTLKAGAEPLLSHEFRHVTHFATCTGAGNQPDK